MPPIPPTSRPPARTIHAFSEQHIVGRQCTGETIVERAACFPEVPVEIVVAGDLGMPGFRQFLLAHLEVLIDELIRVTGMPPRLALVDPSSGTPSTAPLPLTVMDAAGRAQLFSALTMPPAQASRTAEAAPASPTAATDRYAALAQHFSGEFHQRFVLTFAAPESATAQLAQAGAASGYRLEAIREPTVELMHVGRTPLTYSRVLGQLRTAVRNVIAVHDAHPGDPTWIALSDTFSRSMEYYLRHAAALEMLPAEGRAFAALPLAQQVALVRPDYQTVGFRRSFDLMTRVNCTERPEGCDVWMGAGAIHLPWLKELGTPEAQRLLVRTVLGEPCATYDNRALPGTGFPGGDPAADRGIETFLTAQWTITDDDRSMPRTVWERLYDQSTAPPPPVGYLLKWSTIAPEVLIDEIVRVEQAANFLVVMPGSPGVVFQVDRREIGVALGQLSDEQQEWLHRRIEAVMSADPLAGVVFCQVFREILAPAALTQLEASFRDTALARIGRFAPVGTSRRVPRDESDMTMALQLLGQHRLFSSATRTAVFAALAQHKLPYFPRVVWNEYAAGLDANDRLALAEWAVQAYARDEIDIAYLRTLIAPFTAGEVSRVRDAYVRDTYTPETRLRDMTYDPVKMALLGLECTLVLPYWDAVVDIMLHHDEARIRNAAAMRLGGTIRQPGRSVDPALGRALAKPLLIPLGLGISPTPQQVEMLTTLLRALSPEELAAAAAEGLTAVLPGAARALQPADVETATAGGLVNNIEPCLGRPVVVDTIFAERFPTQFRAYVLSALTTGPLAARADGPAHWHSRRLMAVALTAYDDALAATEARVASGDLDSTDFVARVRNILEVEEAIPFLLHLATADTWPSLQTSALHRLAHLQRIAPETLEAVSPGCRAMITAWRDAPQSEHADTSSCRREIAP